MSKQQIKTQLFDNDKEWGRLMDDLAAAKENTDRWYKIQGDIKEVNRARNHLLLDLKQEGD